MKAAFAPCRSTPRINKGLNALHEPRITRIKCALLDTKTPSKAIYLCFLPFHLFSTSKALFFTLSLHPIFAPINTQKVYQYACL